jgi:SAM-dependent methyltransferase
MIGLIEALSDEDLNNSSLSFVAGAFALLTGNVDLRTKHPECSCQIAGAPIGRMLRPNRRGASMTLTEGQGRYRTPLTQRLQHPAYPRASTYDPHWVMENLMGPNVLWLAEALSLVVQLQPGMRVLDMGCGKAASSIFLAKEFGVTVWANDLWISASDNWQRVCAAGLENQVFPIHAEAHALPYAEGFFDALVSMDAYHYFGTDDLYIDYFAKFVRPGGQIGIVVPGLQQEFPGDAGGIEHRSGLPAGLPEHLAPYWVWDYCSFHSPDWWRNHWNKTGKVAVTHADFVPEGWQDWLLWGQVCAEAGYPSDAQEMEMLQVDNGRNLGFSRVAARRL